MIKHLNISFTEAKLQLRFTVKQALLLLSVITCGLELSAQTTRSVSSASALSSAISSSSNGDIIEITDNIVTTGEFTISKTLTLNGNGYYISVSNPGVQTNGANLTSGFSNHRVFKFSGTLSPSIR